jgi:rSAM/selenodomain-associated transferase 1
VVDGSAAAGQRSAGRCRVTRDPHTDVAGSVTAEPRTDARRGVVVVFAKAPRPGLVKTRMSPTLSPEQAALLYGAMLDDVLEETGRAMRSLGLLGVVAVHPADGCVEVARRAPPGYRVLPQRGPGLSARMKWAVGEALAGGASRVLLRGSDNPALGEERLSEALEGLHHSDVVLCPDLDGGYGVVGVRGPVPGLFDHPMSTRSVLRDTIRNAESLGLSTHSTAPGFDLDTPADFAHLADARQHARANLCPRTLAFLDDHELWGITAGA